MKTLRKTFTILTCVALASSLSFALVQEGGSTPSPSGTDPTCIGQRACQVESKVTTGGTTSTCGVAIRILGVGGGILGATCHEFETKTPAHQVCHGASAEGMKCVPDSVLQVMTRECSCGGLVVPIINTGFPVSCDCGDWSADGTVEDFKTVKC